MAKCIFAFFLTVVVQTAFAQDLQSVIGQLQSKPYDTSNGVSIKQNQKIFEQYCTGEADSQKRPFPKYDNDLVATAALLLQKSKSDADAKLLENIAKTWAATVEGIKTQLEAVKASTQDPQMIATIENLQSSMSADKPGISEEQKSQLNGLAKGTMEQLKLALAGLSNISSEFKPVDYPLVEKLVDQFLVQLIAQLKIVEFDVNLLDAPLAQYKAELALYSGSPNKETVLAAMENLLAELNKMTIDKDSELSWYKQYLTEYISALKNSTPADQDLQYYLNDTVYYYNQFKDVFSPEAVVQSNILLEQYAIIFSANIIASLPEIEKTIAAIKNGEKSMSNEIWTVQDYVNQVSIYAQISNSADFIKSANALEASFKAFQKNGPSQSVIDTVKLAQNSFKTVGDAPQALSELVYMEYDFDQVKSKLDTATIEIYAKIKAEGKKLEQESVTTQITEVNQQLAAAAPTLEALSNVGYMASSIANMLKDLSPNFSQASQEAVAKLVAASSAIDPLSNLYYSVEGGSSTTTDSEHFYFYGGINRIYKTYEGDKPYGEVAHKFLIQLCGEFRDRATMIEAKLKWIGNMYTIPTEQIQVAGDFKEFAKKNVWSQMSAQDYFPFLALTEQRWHAVKELSHQFLTIGQYSQIDNPVEGPSVCETKYIFFKYIKNGKTFDDIESYRTDYEQNYKDLCTQADQEDYYDFRGDSNFKHYSPESNAMIWRALSVARACSNQFSAKDTIKTGEVETPNTFGDDVCKDYFRRPFFYRYNSARSALATGLFYNTAYNSSFDSQGNNAVKVYSHQQPELAPMSFEVENDGSERYEFESKWLEVEGAWNKPGLGFNEWLGLGGNAPDLQTAYERLRGSVDRHTNWYSASYTDKNGELKDQAFSPFVASSYVMQASDAFTTCGITVNCPPDGLRRWMFIFRVKKDNWYNPQRLLNNEPVDFDKMWFDETSFGDSGLANGENAWDRLGTAVESELDSILYLINVDGGDLSFGGEGEFEPMFEEGMEEPAG